MAQLHYSPLANQDEIRVIQLLTSRDHPSHATGPVHCRIEHVSLESSHLNTEGRDLKKGFDNTWPSPVAKDIETEPQKRLGADSNVLWKKSFTGSVSKGTWRSSGCLPPSSSCRSDLKFKTNHGYDAKIQNPRQDSEAGLPWRYTWGDFVALSYVWGDSSVKREIYVNNTLVLVTANLEAALHELQNHSRIRQGFRIWIDALCINQADLDERAAQVTRMKDIYARAWHVVVWLGPEAKNEDLAMMAIQYLSIRSQENEPLKGLYRRVDRYLIRIPWFQWKHQHTSLRIRKDVLRAIYHFLARPYWRRLWIIQEIALGARKSPVLCGDSCILLEDVYNALQVIRRDGAPLGRYIINFAKGGVTANRAWDPIQRDTYTISERLWERPNAIIETLLEQKGLAAKAVYSGVFGALVLSREACTTDERDRVYGILGLPCLAGVVDILADYNCPPTKIFTTFSESLFLSGDLNGLRLVSSAVPQIGTRYLKSSFFSRPRAPKLIHNHRTVNQGCRHDLPSWVICWSCPHNPALPLPSCFSAFVSKPYIARPISHERLLTVQGVLFDIVGTLSTFHATESNRKYPQNGPRRTSIYGSKSATKEAFWRTLVANTDRSGQLAPATYSAMLDPQIWDVGIPGVDNNNINGLKDFYHRNKSLMIFNQSLSDLIRGPKITVAQRVRTTFDTTGRLLRPTPILREATLRAKQLLAWRRLVTTFGGYLGLVPAGTRAGDMIAVLMGCDVPLILRPTGGDTCRFSVIGECYVHGIMSGEMQDFLEQGRCKVVPITIC